MISKKQIAHDLAIAYINNKYGPNVNGDFSVTGSNNDIYGSGSVETKFLPDVDKKKISFVNTGEKTMFGLVNKKKPIEDGYLIDSTFKNMIIDYKKAYSRFLNML